MKKRFLKSVILIALMCLSFSAFAQEVTTYIYFDPSALPTCPAGKPDDITIVVTYYKSDNTVYNTPQTTHYDNIPSTAPIPFPGPFEDVFTIAYTKIALYFYGNYCGTGQNFPGVPGHIAFPMHFTGDWWYTISKKQGL